MEDGDLEPSFLTDSYGMLLSGNYYVQLFYKNKHREKSPSNMRRKWLTFILALLGYKSIDLKAYDLDFSLWASWVLNLT